MRVVQYLVPGMILTALAAAQPWLEARMWLHMGVELPLLFLAGGLAGVMGGVATLSPRWNERGVVGLAAASLLLMFWMLPVALDAAVLLPTIGLLKVLTVVASGIVFAMSYARAPTAVQGFFIFNVVWMTATTGLLYQQAPDRLCSTYRLDDQVHAGTALVAWAIAGMAAWLWHVFGTPSASSETSSTVARQPLARTDTGGGQQAKADLARRRHRPDA